MGFIITRDDRDEDGGRLCAFRQSGLIQIGVQHMVAAMGHVARIYRRRWQIQREACLRPRAQIGGGERRKLMHLACCHACFGAHSSALPSSITKKCPPDDTPMTSRPFIWRLSARSIRS